MPVLIEGLTHVYLQGTPGETVALEGIDLEIKDGEFLGLIGPTGSGKSTLAQHLNALLLPTRGRVLVDGADTRQRDKQEEIRRKVGLVFQYPEHQLFEETVFDDVAFGPRNLGLPPREVERRVAEALRLVGLGQEVARRSPFELSGGRMRRAAIAGVLAMEPRVLVLDEPAAGLDPRGREEIFRYISRLHREQGLTVVLVSHQMAEVARLANRLVVLHRGKITLSGPPREVFQQTGLLRGLGLDAPPVVELMQLLAERGYPGRTDLLTVGEARREIGKWLKGKRACSGILP